MTSVIIPNSVTGIRYQAFKGCSNLINIAIPDSVTYISEGAFYGCINLADVYYTGTEEQWQAIDISSYSNNNLTNATIHYNYTGDIPVPTLKPTPTPRPTATPTPTPSPTPTASPTSSPTAKPTLAPIGKPESGVCGDNLKWTIDEYGTLTISGTGDMPDYYSEISPWRNNQSITSVIIEDGVTNISYGTFMGCSSLKSVALGKDVKSIDKGAFDGTNIENIYISDLAAYLNMSSLSELTSYTKKWNLYLNDELVTSLVISDNITSIGDCAFYNCSGITDIYYTGTEEEWNNIKIGWGNDNLTKATIHYDYTKPVTTPVPTPTPNPDIVITTPDTYTINTIEKTDSGVTLTVQTNEDVSGKQTVMAACYDEKGVFVGLQYQQISASEKEQTINFDIKNKDTATVKAFIWNAIDYMMPASRPVSLEL